MNRIRKLRNGRSMTQEALALAAGLSVVTVKRAEAGRPLAPETVLSLAAVFGVTPSEIQPSPSAPEALPRLTRPERWIAALPHGDDILWAGYFLAAMAVGGGPVITLALCIKHVPGFREWLSSVLAHAPMLFADTAGMLALILPAALAVAGLRYVAGPRTRAASAARQVVTFAAWR